MIRWATTYILFSFAVLNASGQAYTFVGDSYAEGNNCYVITPNQLWQNGAVWYNDPIDLNEAFHLQFIMSFGDDDNGADGMVFVMQQVGNDVLGEDGGGIGFSGFAPSLGVEFDTYQNLDFGDPSFDHLALLRQGNVNHNNANNLFGPVQASPTGFSIEDGQDHIVDIFWEPSTFLFSVWFDCVPRINFSVNLLETIFQNNPNVFWGFTGATGGLANLQRVCLDPQILGVPEMYESCPGDDVQLQTTGASAGTYVWEPAQFLDDPTSNNPIATVSETTTFTVTYTDLCDTQEIQTTEIVVYDPQVDLGEDIVACEDSTPQLSVPDGFDQVTWSDGSTENILDIVASGTYGVTVIEGICEASDEINVTINPAPEVEIPELITICQGETYDLDLSALPYSFEWSNGSASPIQSFSEPGDYSLTASLGDCNVTVDFTIEVTSLVSFDFGDDTSICEGESLELDTEVTGSTVQWSTGESGPSITVSESGTYWAMSGGSDCIFSDTITVTVEPTPDVAIDGLASFCEGQSTTLTASGADAFLWGDGSENAQITAEQSGVYTVTGTFSATGCAASASFQVTVTTPPGISLPEKAVKCADETLTIRALSASTVYWDHGPIGERIDVSEPGIYTAEVSNGCGTSSASIIVEDDDCFNSLFIPTAFTPDGDGLNDLFRPVGERVKLFEMQIYDRWGVMVFESTELSQAWNGSFRNGGYYCEAGTYAIKYTVEWDDGTIEERMGKVLLVR